LKEKVEYNKKKYGKNWMFMITDRNLYKKYSKYGKVITKKVVVSTLKEIIKSGTVDF